MLNGYFLQGAEEEYIFVLKTQDPEVIHRLLQRLCKTRDRDLQELGCRLEKDFNDRLYSNVRPKNTNQIQNSKRNKNRKDKDAKPGA